MGIAFYVLFSHSLWTLFTKNVNTFLIIRSKWVIVIKIKWSGYKVLSTRHQKEQPIFFQIKRSNWSIFTKLVFRGGGAPLTKGLCCKLRKCKWLVLYLISCWYDMKQSKTCTKIIKLWYLSGYWSFHKFIRISSYSLPTPNFITGKFVHFKLENLGDRNSLIDLRNLGNLMTKVWTVVVLKW